MIWITDSFLSPDGLFCTFIPRSLRDDQNPRVGLLDEDLD